jgi:hypothetical protein
MKLNVLLIFIVTMFLLGSGVYLNLQNREYWGWFLGCGVLSLIVMAGMMAEGDKEKDEEWDEGSPKGD